MAASRKRTRRPSHPGVVFYADVLEPLNISISEAARKLNVSRKHLSQLCNGNVRLTPEVAAKWAEATGTTAESWLNMQTAVDLWELDKEGKPDVQKLVDAA